MQLMERGTEAWDEDWKEFMLCPVTLDLFKDPVTTSIGHTYEREMLAKTFQIHGPMDPVTR